MPGRLSVLLMAAQALVALAFHPLAHQLANAPCRFGGLAGPTLGRLFVGTAVLHLAEHTFTLQLFLQRAQSLVDVVVANLNVNDGSILQLVRGHADQ